MNPPVKVLFTNIVNEALELVHGQLDARNVRIEFQDIQGVSISGDHMRLVEAFQNLLDNAAKFMGNQPAPMITIGSTKDGRNERIFYVQDNGIGIASEYHERIFGLFNKLNSSTEGTGIGLTLVKRIIEVHGGRIWLESRPAEGATFYFTLP
jgi:signal transduction histidine kinase